MSPCRHERSCIPPRLCHAFAALFFTSHTGCAAPSFSFVFAGGLARGLGFLMGSYTSDGDPSLRMDVVFCGAALYVAVVGFASVLWLPEASTHAQSSNNFAAEAVGGISLVAQSKLLRLAFVAQMLAYLAWCAIFMFGAEWLAEYAFDGGTDPSSSDFVWVPPASASIHHPTASNRIQPHPPSSSPLSAAR